MHSVWSWWSKFNNILCSCQTKKFSRFCYSFFVAIDTQKTHFFAPTISDWGSGGGRVVCACDRLIHNNVGRHERCAHAHTQAPREHLLNERHRKFIKNNNIIIILWNASDIATSYRSRLQHIISLRAHTHTHGQGVCIEVRVGKAGRPRWRQRHRHYHQRSKPARTTTTAAAAGAYTHHGTDTFVNLRLMQINT